MLYLLATIALLVSTGALYLPLIKSLPVHYVIHHHIINDFFGGHLVSLTCCAMCRSIIPIDVTDIGPLFGASLKNANMIVADSLTSRIQLMPSISNQHSHPDNRNKFSRISSNVLGSDSLGSGGEAFIEPL
jgi:hypothetical protein